MGRSFHWMDRANTLRQLDRMVEPGGAVVLFGDKHPDLPQNAVRQAFREIIGRYAAADEHRQQRREQGKTLHIPVLLDSAFCELEQIATIERRELPASVLIDRALSMSSTSRAKIGDKVDAMLAEIAAFTAKVAPSGKLVEVVASTSAHRPPGARSGLRHEPRQDMMPWTPLLLGGHCEAGGSGIFCAYGAQEVLAGG